MREKTIVPSTEPSTREGSAEELAATLVRARLIAERPQPDLYRLRSPASRTVYVEEQRHGAGERTTWVVHADAFGGQAASQVPCATIARVLIAIRAAQAATAPPPALTVSAPAARRRLS